MDTSIPLWQKRMEELRVSGENFAAINGEKEAQLAKNFGMLEMLATKGKAAKGQKEKARSDQVKNSAGGFVFAVSDVTRVRRFLILGTDGGTYYSKEKTLRMENLSAMIKIIDQGNAHMILTEVRAISVAGRNPRQDPLMFTLALCARYRVCDVNEKKVDQRALTATYKAYLNAMHRAALSIVNDVCRIPTHLFQFVEYCELVSQQTAGNKERKSTGWGRAMRDTIARWYTAKKPDQLAMAVTKYQQREGWSHRDLFRLSHPKVAVKTDDPSLLELEQIYHFIAKGALQTRKRRLSVDEQVESKKKYTEDQLDQEDNSSALDLIETFKSLKGNTEEYLVVDAIRAHGLVREHIPSEHLNSIAVWEALLDKMPMTALIRNLGKMQAINLIKGDKITKLCKKLGDEGAIRASRVHPIQVLMAHEIYSRGRGDKGSLSWHPNPTITSAIEKAFYLSFQNVTPTGKRICFAFDVSGSMNSQIMDSCLTCRKASVAMGMVGLRTEKEVEVVAFCGDLVEIPFDRSWTLEQTCQYFDGLHFGTTDCAQPMLWATKNKKKFDCFCVFTDNETYFGKVHPYQALRDYRKASGIEDAKLIVFGMTATNFSIADPNDAGMLDVCGFDAALPEIMASFIRGDL
ncbi:unnamed protein product, partial [Mesorhabditis belari]|uniref:TROVE domain-containing protein n=1 Tax=Mesorhabditis belari TaxID=2138241 RepID=A0AAF3EMP2_9BILA